MNSIAIASTIAMAIKTRSALVHLPPILHAIIGSIMSHLL